MSAIILRRDLSFAGQQNYFRLDDPGDAGALPASEFGYVEMTSGASGQTRTLAAPTGLGLKLGLVLDVDGGGDIVVTVTNGYNQAAATTLTFADAGDFVVLESIRIGSTYRWRVVASDGVAVTKDAQNFTAYGLTVGGVIVDPYIRITVNIPLASGMVNQTPLIADRALQLVGATFSHAVASGGAGKLQLTKDTGTTAPGAGTGLLTNNTNTGFDVNATANTVQTGTLTATTADLQLASGNRLGIGFSGTVTSLTKVCVTLIFKPI